MASTRQHTDQLSEVMSESHTTDLTLSDHDDSKTPQESLAVTASAPSITNDVFLTSEPSLSGSANQSGFSGDVCKEKDLEHDVASLCEYHSAWKMLSSAEEQTFL